MSSPSEGGPVAPRPAPPVWYRVLKVVLGLGLVALLAFGVYAFLDWKTVHYRSIRSAALSPDGSRVAVGHGGGLGRDASVRIWETSTGRADGGVDSLPAALVVKWSPGGRLLATGFDDGTIGIWDPGEWRRVATLDGTAGVVDDVAWSPDGTRVAAGDDYGKVRIWEAETGTLTGTHAVHEENIACVVWSPDGTLVASAGWDGFTRVVEAATGRQLLAAPDTSFVKAVAWSADGKLLASGGIAKIVHVYDVAGARQVFALSGHTNSVSDLAWSPDGRSLVSSGDDDTMRVWDAATGKQLQAFDLGDVSEPNVMWSPAGERIAGAGRSGPCVWNTAGGAVQRLEGGDTWRSRIVGWTPDGTKVVVLDLNDDSVNVWDVANRNRLHELRMPLLESIRRALF
jgi:WD40 repeat protein